MKRKIAAGLALSMSLATLLSACGGDSGETSGSASGTSGQESTSSEASVSEETAHIIVTYPYSTTEPEDLEKVQDAVNEITIPAINVEVEFKAIGMSDTFSNYSLWISSGETVDLMMIAFQDLKTYANSGQIDPLDDLLSEETTPVLWELSQEFPILTTVAGETYGITPVGVNYGDQPGLVMRQDWLEETGYETKDIYTIEDVTNIFAAIKENHPDAYPYGVLGSSITSGSTYYTMLYTADILGGNVIAGVLFDADSTEVENLFTSDQYKEYLQQLADWYEAGYILPDAATTDSSSSELLMNDRIACYPMSNKPEQFGSSSYSFDLTGVATDEAYIGAQSNLTNWTIPITAQNPEAAVKFLDYLYSDHDLSNLIMYGIQGEHYTIVDEENGVIDFANDYDGTTSPYYNILGFWGDRRYEYTFDASATRAEHDAFTEEAMSNQYLSYGFSFDSSNVSNQIIACQSVLDQYQKALETGTLGSDWEATYETMISQLETAGINDVIEECQTQFDAFLEASQE